MRCWHITLSSFRRSNLFPEEASRRRAVTCIVRVASQSLLLFCVVDDHIHVVVACEATEVGHIRRALALALSSLAGERLVSHARPIENRAHLHRLVRYLLTQVSHHGIAAHPAAWSGSCFQDLIGARRLPGFAPRIGRALPRLGQEELHAMVGLPRRSLEPALPESIRAAGVVRIAGAAAAAVAADPALAGKCAQVVAAKGIAAHVAALSEIARRDTAWALGVTRQRVGQLLAQPIDDRMLRAARLQLSLEAALACVTTAIPSASPR